MNQPRHTARIHVDLDDLALALRLPKGTVIRHVAMSDPTDVGVDIWIEHPSLPPVNPACQSPFVNVQVRFINPLEDAGGCIGTTMLVDKMGNPLTCERCGQPATSIVQDLIRNLKAELHSGFVCYERFGDPHLFCDEHRRESIKW